MREIKFRAWVFGDLDEGANPFMADVYAIVFEPEGPCVQWEEFDEISCPGEFSLMQYTGLKDTAGKEIYEGDIVRCLDTDDKEDIEETWRGVVKFGGFNCSCCDGVFGFYIEGGDIRGLEDQTTVYEYEIIGNIYENPELVKHG
jgi:uncharacterized phage protein (TIGR01671 family)